MILAVCDEVRQMCCNLKPFLIVIQIIIDIAQFSVPLILMVLGTIDMVKAVASGDEKVASEVKKTFISRLIYAVLIFLIPFIIELILKFVEEEFVVKDDLGLISSTSWVSCWNNVSDDDNYCSTCNDIYLPDNDIDNDEDDENNTIQTKTCYVYEQYNKTSCSKYSTRYSYENGFCRIEVSSGMPYRGAGNTFNKSQCSSDCNSYYGSVPNDVEMIPVFDDILQEWVPDNNSCMCKYIPDENKVGSTIAPGMSVSGEVDKYKCDISIDCNSADLMCDFVDTIKVNKE